MSIINITNGQIPLSAYLKADPYSQVFVLIDEQGKKTKIVTPEMFWGDINNNESIYLSYSKISNRRIEISEGLSTRRGIRTLRASECDQWIDNNLAQVNMSKLYVVQGYAGCGKTTLLNYLIHKKGNKEKILYIDVGESWSYQNEPYMFFNQVLKQIDICIEKISRNKECDKIWQKFIEIGTETRISDFDLDLPNIISKMKSIKEDSTWKKLKDNVRQFLFETFSERSEKDTTKNIHKEQHIVGQIDAVVALLIILMCAHYYFDKKNKISQTLIFDNLDVITNPAIPAEIVVSLWGVIYRYNKFKEFYYTSFLENLPNFNIIISVRKVLYSHLVSHLPDLEMKIKYDPFYINVCDISNLFLSQDVLEHHIDYWKDRINDENTKEKLEQLREIKTITSSNELEDIVHVDNTDNENQEELEIQRKINLDAFFNHNYRAFTNMLSAFFEDNRYSLNIIQDFNRESNSTEWQKVATLIFEISLFYRKKEVWNNLGFGCKDFNIIDYPTTFNRLILNYLYVAKVGQKLRQIAPERDDIPFESDVSLRDLANTFNELKFILASVDSNEAQIESQYNSSDSNGLDLLIERLSNMCARNPRKHNNNAYGYDFDDEELWRRPLFFTGGVKLYHTAASDIELKTFFDKCITEENDDKIKFAITDEGLILIHDIVANFEFYSARYCGEELAKPLHQSITVNEINTLISPVYDAIKSCCERHNLFMKNYMKTFNINLNEYLARYFHPRTNPRFTKKSIKKGLKNSSFRPQLHIVRVIYSHISYFLEVKLFFESSNNIEKDTICNCLYDWIGRYLTLYKDNFYEKLKNSICQSDNNVYDDIFKKYAAQSGQYKKFDILEQ